MMLPLLLMVFASLCAADERQVFGDSHSSINMTISYGEPRVKDITWIREADGDETRVAKTKDDDKSVDILSNRYGTSNNGRVLIIHDLTTNDSGRYVAYITLLDNTIIKEEFNLTVQEPIPPEQIIAEEKNEEKKKSYDILIIVLCIVGAPVVLAVLVWTFICYKKSSNTTGQGDQSEEIQTNQMKMWLSEIIRKRKFTRMKTIWQQGEQDEGVVEYTVNESNPGPSSKYLLQEKEDRDKLIQKKGCFLLMKAKL
ncbi:uncharacterized protein LOC122921852 isoform X2 [Bufo gargarizans]|uniref:uncharacterized protein LOC122921852 isoform X2 n=1 Tax=Bufo gargarizans TaxID=30331 RepID=UPI001CF2C660|nr:uncharacterized protein LOC122921852 isoform X2 [Bufo gargarizans]